MVELEGRCDHCGDLIQPGHLVTGDFSGRQLSFCCPGCRGAYALITGAGLDSFYAKREWKKPGTPEGAFEKIYRDEYLNTFVSRQGEFAKISFIVSGIRCAACIWLIESILGRTAGIEEATVNYGTHRGQVRYDPAQISPAAIFQAVSQLGYAPKPFTQDAVRSMQEQEHRTLLIRFSTAAFLSMQLMGYSIALYGGYFSGMDPATKHLLQYFTALVATPVVFFAGAPFLRGAWRSITNRAPNMDLLIALGVLAAYLYSLGAMIVGGEVFFETSAMIITLILLGRIFENSARRKAYSAIDKMFNLAPDTARLVINDETVLVTSNQLQVGDTILVGAGDRLPVDGVLLDQQTEMDESVLTGEAQPVLRHQDDHLLSGSMNVSTAVRVRVTQTAGKSYMARIAAMIEEAQNRKAPVQGLADRVAGMFIPTVIAMALVTAIYWGIRSPGHLAPLLYSISVLVVACPCALGLATPTAILVATGVAAGRGILFRGGDTLEAASRLTVAGFDKTGTLTEPFLQVASMAAINGNESELLSLAARAESGSSHPLAQGIQTRAARDGLQTATGGGVIVPGRGIRLISGKDSILAGSRTFMAENSIVLPTERSESALTEVHVAHNGGYKGCIYLDSQLREGAREMIEQVSSLGIHTFLLTGDHPFSAEHIAALAGIKTFFANMSPAEKTEWVQEKRKEDEIVLMVGDGVNDAPALSAASVGCAMSGGTDIALETSDLVLMHDDLQRLPEAIALARRTLSIIRQNLFWAFSYNLVAIPLAAAGYLAPVYAAAAMAGSSLCVVANSLRIRSFRMPLRKQFHRERSLPAGESHA